MEGVGSPPGWGTTASRAALRDREAHQRRAPTQLHRPGRGFHPLVNCQPGHHHISFDAEAERIAAHRVGRTVGIGNRAPLLAPYPAAKGLVIEDWSIRSFIRRPARTPAQWVTSMRCVPMTDSRRSASSEGEPGTAV